MRVADSSGEAVDNKTRLEVIRQQETLIKEEAAEKKKEVGNLTHPLLTGCSEIEGGDGGSCSCGGVSSHS